MRPSLLVAASVLAIASVASAADPPPPQLRLPTSVRPLRYAARLTVRPTEPTFDGAIDIALTLDAATDVVWLNATSLVVNKASFVVGGATLPARVIPGGVDFLGFAAERPLPAGAASLHIEYSGTVSRTDDRGLFAQKERDRWYAISQFEAIFARRVFPCFDEPSFKVPWQLTLEVPESETVLSNTHGVRQTHDHPGMKTVAFAPTAPLPSYLIAFAVGPYQVLDAGHAGMHHTPLRVAVPAGRGGDAEDAVKTTGTLVELLERYFAMPFPYEKLDVVAIPLPTQFGAMENAGMVTDSQSLMVAPASDRGVYFERGYAQVNAHEFAHQWFGDLVTTAWWDDIWLNESFASWLESKVIEQWKPEWSHGTSTVDARAWALGADALISARQIRQPIITDDDIFNIFDAITYSKGQSVLSMFEHFVGADVFQRGVRSYIAAHANGNANADQFVAAISEASGKDLSAAFRSFLDQPGAPLVEVTLSCTGPPTLTLKQQRFLPVGSRGKTAATWGIPFCARYVADGKSGRTCALLTEPQMTIPLETTSCPTWLLANEDEVGYFRAAYDGDLLAKLLTPEGKQRLTLPELLGVVDDLEALVDAGRVDEGRALALAPLLAEDPRRRVASEAIDLIGNVRDHLLLPSVKPAYVRMVQKVLGPRARALGFTPAPGEDDDTRLLRPRLLGAVANYGEDAVLTAEAGKLAQRWLADHSAVSPDLVDTVLHIAVLHGDQKLFDQLHAAARAAKDRNERRHLLSALGAFRDPALIRQAEQIALSEEFDAREGMGLLFAGEGRQETRQLGWDNLKKNWDALVKRLPAESLSGMPFIAASFCDAPHQRDMEAFFKDRSPKLPGGAHELAQAVESTEICQALVKKQQPSVTAFLRKW